MRAARLYRPREPLILDEVSDPQVGPHEVVLRVQACGVCRTDLHLVDGELPQSVLPVIPGHQVVGRVVELGAQVRDLAVGERVGVPWLYWACGQCHDCANGQENLCPHAEFTGYTRDGGFAERMRADARFTLRLPDIYDDVHAAPLLCAGLIGYRALRLAGAAQRLGFYGFGAAAHILVQVARHLGREVYAFTRPDDLAAQSLALELGAVWAGDSTQPAPVALDAALIFAPVGALVPVALRAVRRGAPVVCAGIHMSDIPSFPYALLWHERVLRSVANLTRQDGIEFLQLAGEIPLRIEVERFSLDEANLALQRLRSGALKAGAVLVP
jgi:propanol-preferring alcohol dehydrogenase